MLPDIEKEIRELTDQLAEGKKVIEVDKKKILLILPNSEQEWKAKLEYSRVLGELLSDGNYKTEAEMKDIMKQRKIWTDKDDNELKKLAEDQGEALNNYIISKTEQEKKKALKKYNEINDKMAKLQGKYNSLMGVTIESMAEEVKNGHLIFRCVKDFETGEPIWATYGDYINETNKVLQGEVTYNFLTFIRGIPQVFLGRLPEGMEESEQSGESSGK